MTFWIVVGVVLAVLLATAWSMDRAVERRGSRVSSHSDVWHQVRESRRDAEVTHPLAQDTSWSSWNGRTQR